MKPGKTFKLRKPTKTMLASITDPVKRDEWKRAMIDAELCSKIVVKTDKRDRNAPRGAPGVSGTTGSHAYTTPQA